MQSRLSTWTSGGGSAPDNTDDETYLKNVYQDIGGQPGNIERVLAVPMGARLPAAYRLIRSDGAWAIVWRKHIVNKDVETISQLLAQIR